MDLPADYWKMNTSVYKLYHESFMQHNTGSTPAHTFFCIFLTIFCTIICSFITSGNRISSYIKEYVIIVLPLVFCHTILAEYLSFINCAIVLVLFVIMHINKSEINVMNLYQPNISKGNLIMSISVMRGLTYLITIYAILAVDFRIFPRYLAKTERYGYSLMDTGVGLFILMSGLVHKSYAKNNFKSVLKDNLKLVVVLTVLGASRFVSIKQLDYQEHVTEYGVHWNFFFTLAAAKTISSVVIYINCCNSLFMSILILIFHEIFMFLGLEDWVLSEVPRDSLLSANREGLSSCLGYVAMYLFAAHFKKVISDKGMPRYRILTKLLYSAVISWALAIIINHYRPTSRTLANAGYCTYLEATLLSFMSILYFFEVTLQDGDKVYFKLPRVVAIMNENGLLVFLSANLLTGAVNLTVRTLLVDKYTAISILNVYLICTIAIGLFLNAKGIRL